MRHHRSAAFVEEPPPSQPSSSNSIPHRKKKRKHRADTNLIHVTANSTSVSSANGRDRHYELNGYTHCDVNSLEEVPNPLQSEATLGGDGFSFGELRQRSFNSSGGFGNSTVTAVDDRYVREGSSVGVSMSETVESLELKCVLAEDSILKKSPVTCYLEKMYNGNSLWSTTTLGNEKGRERVYDTIFRLPWRCELVFAYRCWLLCLLQFIPVIVNCHAYKDGDDCLEASENKTIPFHAYGRKFKKLSTIELSDFGCFLIMACGVTVLQQIDISLIYHIIRGQATIKLYVIYNVLEIFDKLCQSFNGDVLQMLFHSAEGLARCPPETESTRFWMWRFISDLVLSGVASIVHSFILLVQAITLSACIVAHYNALPALLVSNNFGEIKSYVFKKYSKDNVHSMVYFDSIERFHISAFILFVLAQNILEAEGPWFQSFLINILFIYLCEMAIDIIKHSFIAKFNNITPIAYSEFLEDLCKQTLHMQTEDPKKKLTFVPVAPACVVIRVLTPVYAAHLPYAPLPWRLFGILLFSAITYIMLTSLKVLIGMILQKHAAWYVNRCQRRKHHLHAD